MFIDINHTYLTTAFALTSSAHHGAFINLYESPIDPTAISVRGNGQHGLLKSVSSVTASYRSTPSCEIK